MLTPRWTSHFGDAKARIGYLSGLKDKAGRTRYATPLVLAGSSSLFLKATRLWWNKRHKFSESGLAFGQRLPKSELEEVRREFEVVVTGGMRDRTYFLWVLHESPREMHLHFLCLNVDLFTGNDFVPYYAPLDRDRLDTYQQIVNTVREYPNPRTRLAAREVVNGGSKKGAIVEVLDASRGRRHLEAQLALSGCTIAVSRSGTIRYFNREGVLCEVAGEPLRDSWIADPAARLKAQIAHLQVRMDEKCRRLQRDCGHAERVDVLTLPSIQLALKMIRRLETSPQPQDLRQRIASRLAAREHAERPSVPMPAPASPPPPPLALWQSTRIQEPFKGTVTAPAPLTVKRGPKPASAPPPPPPVLSLQPGRLPEQNTATPPKEVAAIPQQQVVKPRPRPQPRHRPKLDGGFTM